MLSQEVFAFGRHADLASSGRAGPVCKPGEKLALHPAGHTEKQRPPPQHPGAAELCSPVEQVAHSANLVGGETQVLPGTIRRGLGCLSHGEQQEGRKSLGDLGWSAAMVGGVPSLLLLIP